MDLISIIMPVYKEKMTYLTQSVESILKQDYPNIEIIIVVDDPTNVEAINYLQKIQKQFKNVRIIINSKNMGIVVSLNRALRLCHGEYIARMDADDISHFNRLSNELNYLKKKQYDLIGSFYCDIDANGVVRRKVKLPVTFKEIKRRLGYTNCLCHPSWIAHRKVFEALNGYRNIPMCEDYDFIIRLCLSGLKCGNIPKYLLNYRYTSLGISNKNFVQQRIVASLVGNQYRNREIKEEKYFLNYLTSVDFQRTKNAYLYMMKLKEEYKNIEGPKKFIVLVKLLFNKVFIKEKFQELLYNA